MKWIALGVIISVLLSGGCVTIVLEEQGNGKDQEPSTNVDTVDDPVSVKIVDEQSQDTDAKQAPVIVEDKQEPILEQKTDSVGASDPDEPTPEEKEYADERLASLREEARRRGDAIPLDDFDSHELLEVLDLDLRKISPSRGSVEEILFVVRNFGDVPLHHRAEFLVETTITNPDFPRVERVEFDLKEIPPGMKIEKRAYLNIEFRPLDYERKWNLRLLTQNYPPSEIATIGSRFRLQE